MTNSTQLTEGAHIPDVVFKTRTGDGPVCGDNNGRWQDMTSAEIFTGKKIVVFALPGAFTPTCSSTHLPGYEHSYEALKATGIDEVYCLAVNDAFVMQRWAAELMIRKVQLLPDGNADFTRGMGMLVQKHNLGFGQRSWRYSMLVDDGIITKLFVEPGFSDNCVEDPFETSGAEAMLEYLSTGLRPF